MKKISIVLFLLSAIMFGFTVKEKINAKALIPEKKMVQVGIIVSDVEKSAKAWTAFLGLDEVPPIRQSENNEMNPTMYKGKPTDAKVKMAFFTFDNIMLELLEPVGGPSTWKEFLDKNGEGIHHIAFDVDETDQRVKLLQSIGIKRVQHGGWATGEYSYMEAKDMGLIIELLEHYNKK